MSVNILGIRHHGVGSARMVSKRLEQLEPDLILIEGPPEIEGLLKEVGHAALIPPVAIMVYDIKDASNSSFYPFAEFSPEWVAAKYANEHEIPIRSLDLPARHSFQLAESLNKEVGSSFKDPLTYCAEIAGFPSGSDWWEHQFEQIKEEEPADHFEAVQYLMKDLRHAELPSALDEINLYREAYMRNILQSAQNEMYSNIAVICGAWHVPALLEIDQKAKADQKTLKRLPKAKTKVDCNWIPWTNSRLSMFSGYGAGIDSPGWSEHQWGNTDDTVLSWLSRIASCFRSEGVDVSTAHVLESYRLAHALAALRNKSQIHMAELNEAILTVMCMGDAILFNLIQEDIIVGEKMGRIPDHLPKVPLQVDFEARAKSMRLSMSAREKQYSLDLRKPLDLKRSIFFHRLEFLDIKWAQKNQLRSKGTFKEGWVLEWSPEMQIALIDKAPYGNTIPEACIGIIVQKMKDLKLIADLVQIVKSCIPADLFDIMDQLLLKISNESAISTDIKDLLSALPGLVEIIKYGDVRNSDVQELEKIAHRLFTKISISLPNACYGLDEEHSNVFFELILKVNHSIQIMEREEWTHQWYQTLERLIHLEAIHPIITGCTCRLLFDNQRIEGTEAEKLFHYYLSQGNPAPDVAAWLEGFLRGSGLILIYDDRIWNLVYKWVAELDKKEFTELLPILRRAFSKFPFGERRQIGEKAKKGKTAVETSSSVSTSPFDQTKAESILPAIQQLLIPQS